MANQYDLVKQLPPSKLRSKRRIIPKIGGGSYEYDSNYTTANYPGDLNTSVAEEFRAPRIEIPAVGEHERIDLPQIQDCEAMMTDLSDRGIRVTRERVDINSLVPTQSEFNEEKVLKIMENPTTAPIVVSRDDFIVDGHHRWLASYNAGSKMIEAIVINLNIRGCLDFLEGKPYVANKSIRESFKVNLVLRLLANFKSVKEALEQGKKLYSSNLKDKDLQIARIARMHGIPPKDFMDLIVAKMNEDELSRFLETVISEEAETNKPFRVPGESQSAIFVESSGEKFLITYTEKNK